MLDSDHSFCAKKISVQSLVPAPKEIMSIVDMHNEERTNVHSKDMQKMVYFSHVHAEETDRARTLVVISSTGMPI